MSLIGKTVVVVDGQHEGRVGRIDAHALGLVGFGQPRVWVSENNVVEISTTIVAVLPHVGVKESRSSSFTEGGRQQ